MQDKVIKNLDEEKELMMSINHHYWDGQEQVMLLTQLQKYQQINVVNFNHKIISFSSKYELQLGLKINVINSTRI